VCTLLVGASCAKLKTSKTIDERRFVRQHAQLTIVHYRSGESLDCSALKVRFADISPDKEVCLGRVGAAMNGEARCGRNVSDRANSRALPSPKRACCGSIRYRATLGESIKVGVSSRLPSVHDH
jgi:hypothetical protein